MKALVLKVAFFATFLDLLISSVLPSDLFHNLLKADYIDFRYITVLHIEVLYIFIFLQYEGAENSNAFNFLN